MNYKYSTTYIAFNLLLFERTMLQKLNLFLCHCCICKVYLCNKFLQERPLCQRVSAFFTIINIDGFLHIWDAQFFTPFKDLRECLPAHTLVNAVCY